jgi:hypothetical protein
MNVLHQTHCADADGQEQQAEISRIASQDSFNWGYDPVHYGVPEGSYSTDSDSTLRVLEYRSMVLVRLTRLVSLVAPGDASAARLTISGYQSATRWCHQMLHRCLHVLSGSCADDEINCAVPTGMPLQSPSSFYSYSYSNQKLGDGWSGEKNSPQAPTYSLGWLLTCPM